MTEEQRKSLYKMLEQGGECKGIKCMDCYFEPDVCNPHKGRLNTIKKILTLEKINLI